MDLTSGVALAGLIGWLVFKHFYENFNSGKRQIDQLSSYVTHAQLQTNLIFQSIADGLLSSMSAVR